MTFVLFGVLLLLFCCNAPIAIAVGVAALAGLFVHGGMSPMLIVQRLYAGADSFPLMAVPLFMIAGQLMGSGGISRRIVRLADALVGHLPGGLAAASIVSAMFFAGISGSAVADTAAVGAILIPAMVRHGYAAPFAGAVQAAAGSIGVIIPPSIPMIIFGALTGASIGRLFAAGILPGILMAVSLIGVCVVHARLNNHTPQHAFSVRRVKEALYEAVWALGAPAIILGGILGGVFTATESAAVAALYAFVIGVVVHRELPLAGIPKLVGDAAVLSGITMFIVCAASVFSWLMAIGNIPAQLAGYLLSLSDNPVILLLLINVLLLLAGIVLETTAALILFVPVLLPMLPVLGIDVIQLGAIMVMNLAIGMLTPPMGVCLIVSCSIAQTRLESVTRHIFPFLAVLLIDLVLITFWAPLTGWLPALLFGNA